MSIRECNLLLAESNLNLTASWNSWSGFALPPFFRATGALMADVTGSWAGAPAYLRIAFTLSLSTERSARVRKTMKRKPKFLTCCTGSCQNLTKIFSASRSRMVNLTSHRRTHPVVLHWLICGELSQRLKISSSKIINGVQRRCSVALK